MSYTVLARRYRSQSFGNVVGQSPVAQTLINAIRTDRVAHAYLFCGTRGVGKTSMARIFARALNAPDSLPDAPHAPGAEYPDQDVQQRMADAIMRGDDLNVIEIDAASNRGVDDARDLISGAGLSPTGNALYKIYIIDEVHMLTREAFNALLKTMEEPPAHVKFILCTTEPHKVPATIQSRCQRFDFRNISTPKIAEHLTDVLARENLAAENEVVWQVARLGNGSMRDALSLMDRLLATGVNPLTAKTLQDMLGLPDHALIAALVDAMADGSVRHTLTATADLLNRGIAQDQLVEVLIERLRQLMLIAACGADSDLVELSDDARPGAVQQAGRFDAPGLVHMIALLENLGRFSKTASNPRALLDATVVRLALAEKMADVSAMLSGGTLPAATSGGEQKKKSAAPGDVGNREQGSGNRGGAQAAMDRGGPSLQPTPHASRPMPHGNAAPTTHTAHDALPGDRPVARVSNPQSAIRNPQSTHEVWQAVLSRVGHTNASAWMDHFHLQALDPDATPATALLGSKMTFAGGARNVATVPRLKRVADTLQELLGKPFRVEVAEQPARPRAKDTDTDPAASDAQRPASGGVSGGGGAVDRRDALNLPLVRDAFDVFPDATLVRAVRETSDT